MSSDSIKVLSGYIAELEHGYHVDELPRFGEKIRYWRDGDGKVHSARITESGYIELRAPQWQVPEHEVYQYQRDPKIEVQWESRPEPWKPRWSAGQRWFRHNAYPVRIQIGEPVYFNFMWDEEELREMAHDQVEEIRATMRDDQ